MGRRLSHDEHMYIASGKLLADQSLIPYKDFPHFQMPNLVFAYAAIFKYTDYLLFSARFFSIICSCLSLALVFYIVFNLFHEHNGYFRFLIAAGSVLLIMTNPFFTYTSGRAWNHDLSLLFTLLAFFFHCRGFTNNKDKQHLFFSGIFLGLAIGTRLTFAIFIIPFLGTVFFYKKEQNVLPKLFLFFVLGVIVAMLPSIIMFSLSPKKFIFDNIGYHKLNTMYFQEIGYTETSTFAKKLYNFIKLIISSPVLFLVFFSASFLLSAFWIGRKQKEPSRYPEIAFILTLFPFLFIASFIPTPSWIQYFYAPMPFLVIGLLYGIETFYQQANKEKWSLIIFVLIVVSSIGYGAKDYSHISKLFSPYEWVPVRVRKIGEEIKSIIGKGKVLTLAPTFPLEGGTEIYAEFATGPFVWSTAMLLSDEQRKDYHLITKFELKQLLQNSPPQAILVGYEKGLEKPLIEYAQENRYSPLELRKEKILWLKSNVK